MNNPDRAEIDAHTLKLRHMINNLDQSRMYLRDVRNELAENLADYLEAKTKGKVP